MTRTAKTGRKRHLKASQWEILCRDGDDGSIDRSETTRSVESVAEDDVIEKTRSKKQKKAKLEKDTTFHEDDSSCVVESDHRQDKPVEVRSPIFSSLH